MHLVCLLNSQDYDRLHNFFFSFYSLPFFTTLSDIGPWVGLVNKTMFPNSYTCRCLSDGKLQLHLHSNALKKKKINIQQFTSNSINNDCVQRQAPSTVHIDRCKSVFNKHQ